MPSLAPAPFFPRLARLAALSVLAAVTGTAGTGTAEIKRHVDEDGVVNFSNAGNKSKKKATALKPTASASGARRSGRGGPASSGASSSRFDPYIREAAALYRIPEELIRAVIKVESNFNPRAVSHANARGLMQLIPPTAERMMVSDVFDPRQNIFGGVRYLRLLANLFNGNLELTLAAYNAGENAVIRYGGIPPYAETQDYVVKVLGHYRRYRTDAALRASQGR